MSASNIEEGQTCELCGTTRPDSLPKDGPLLFLNYFVICRACSVRIMENFRTLIINPLK